MEHTFGDAEMSKEPLNPSDVAKLIDEPQNIDLKASHKAAESASTIPWLHSKQDNISLSTDSMFNLHDEEVKQLLKDENGPIKCHLNIKLDNSHGLPK